jgi:TorA maturation chaperone TorD
MEPWMGRLFHDIATAKSADFYRAVAALGSAFLSVEQSWLSLP